MASLRGEIGCTGEASVRQWRAATFVTRLGAFVTSRHFFGAFVTHFRAAYTPASCSRTSQISSSERGAARVQPIHPENQQDEVDERPLYTGSTRDSYYSSSHDEAVSDPRGSCGDAHEDFEDALKPILLKPQHGINISQKSVSSSTASHACVHMLVCLSVQRLLTACGWIYYRSKSGGRRARTAVGCQVVCRYHPESSTRTMCWG